MEMKSRIMSALVDTFIKKRELEDNYNYRDWVNEILSSVAYGLKNGNYNV